MFWWLAACGEPPSGDGRVVFTNVGGDTVPATPRPETTPQTTPPGTALELVDSAGEPLAGWTLTLLDGILERAQETDAQGQAVFEDLSPGPYLLQTRAPEGAAAGLPPLPLQLEGGQTLKLHALELGPLSPLQGEPQELELGQELFVQAALGDLSPPVFAPEADALAGVRVPPAQWPPLAGLTGEPLAVWYVGPFQHTAPEGLPIRVGETLGVPGGEPVRVWMSEEGWQEVGWLASDGQGLEGEALLPWTGAVVLTY